MGIRSNMGMGEDVSGGVTAGAFRMAPWHGVGDCLTSTGLVVGHKYLIEGDPRTADEIMDLASAHWEPEEKILADYAFNKALLNQIQDELNLSDIQMEKLADLLPDSPANYGGAEKVKFLTRPDRRIIIGNHSDEYGVIPNRTGFEFVAKILELDKSAHLVSTVELFGGEVMFSVIEFDRGVEAVRHNGRTTDKITRYMGVFWSHNGRYNLVVKFMNELWVCRNTFTPRVGITGITIRHTRNAPDIAKHAIHSLDRMLVASEQFDREVQWLLDIEASRETMAELVIPKVLEKKRPEDGRSQTIWDNQFDAIMAEWNEFTDTESAFDCVMAVQGWEQHRQQIQTARAPRDVRCIKQLMNDDYPRTQLAYSCFPLPGNSNN